MRHGFTEFAATAVEHRNEDPQADICRPFGDSLSGKRKSLLEIASPSVLDSFLPKRRDVIHALAYNP
jgi:hypothetical protein